MNNILKGISIVLLVLNCLTLSAQNQKEQLAGTWTLDFNASTANMEAKAKTILQKIPSAQQKLEKAYKNRQITFGNDGHYVLRLADGSQTSGTWILNGSSQQGIITLTSSQNHIQNLAVIMLSNNALVLKQQDSSRGTAMLSRLYYTKI